MNDGQEGDGVHEEWRAGGGRGGARERVVRVHTEKGRRAVMAVVVGRGELRCLRRGVVGGSRRDGRR